MKFQTKLTLKVVETIVVNAMSNFTLQKRLCDIQMFFILILNWEKV